MEYNHKKIESKWRKYWAVNNTYKVLNSGQTFKAGESIDNIKPINP